MAYVVSRPNGTWEARESERTPDGPRSRTLATFRVLTPEVEEKVRARSKGAFDVGSFRRRARRAGAPVGTEADRVAAQLVRAMSRGERPSRPLRTFIADDLESGSGLPHQIERMKRWAVASPRERGEALIELLGVGDALPPRAREPERERFPRISSVS